MSNWPFRKEERLALGADRTAGFGLGDSVVCGGERFFSAGDDDCL
jgi:hypothetical protein